MSNLLFRLRGEVHDQHSGDFVLPGQSAQTSLCTRPELFTAGMIFDAAEYVGDWWNADPSVDRGGDFRAQWTNHLRAQQHAVAVSRDSIPTILGCMYADNQRPHKSFAEVGGLPTPYPGFVMGTSSDRGDV